MCVRFWTKLGRKKNTHTVRASKRTVMEKKSRSDKLKCRPLIEQPQKSENAFSEAIVGMAIQTIHNTTESTCTHVGVKTENKLRMKAANDD